MKKRRSFFLLEIVIAIALVGIFVMGFLGSGLRYLAQERKALLELEFEQQRDLIRMDTIAACWKEIQTSQEERQEPWVFEKVLRANLGGKEYTKSYRLKAVRKKAGDGRVLVLQEGTQKYHFLVKNSEALSK